MAQTRTYAVRVTKNFSDLIEKYIEMDTHLNPSELLRDALREKIKRDAPELYSELFKEAS